MLWNSITQKERVNLKIIFFLRDRHSDENFFYILPKQNVEPRHTKGKSQLENKFFIYI